MQDRAQLLLVDEPTAGLAPNLVEQVYDILIAARKASGIAILLTDHRERETLTITDRNYIICHGTVIVSGNAETVLNDSIAQDLYFGKRFDAGSIIDQKSSYRSEVAELTGPELIVTAIAGEQRVLASLPPRTHVQEGQSLRFGFDPESMHIFSAESGARLN